MSNSKDTWVFVWSDFSYWILSPGFPTSPDDPLFSVLQDFLNITATVLSDGEFKPLGVSPPSQIHSGQRQRHCLPCFNCLHQSSQKMWVSPSLSPTANETSAWPWPLPKPLWSLSYLSPSLYSFQHHLSLHSIFSHCQLYGFLKM